MGRADVHEPVVAETDREIHKHVHKVGIYARAAHMHMNLHVTDWDIPQQEDPVLNAMLNWILNQRVQDLKHLLGDNVNTKDGMAILLE